MYRLISYFSALLFVLSILIFVKLEEPLFNTPHATILRDKNGELISCQIATDYQWRFPIIENVPYKFSQAITVFEDKNFYKHNGIDPLAIIRAFYLNMKNRKVISGASTITMQVIRLSRGKSRTILEKIIESILAIKLEALNNKTDILKLYSSYAPFGGNVVGLSGASWRYYNRDPSELSWGETVALAVLPNSPGLIYPGRNETPFRIKRDKLLNSLFLKNIIDEQTYKLALQEPLPSKPKRLPDFSRHLLNKAVNDGYRGQKIDTTIDLNLQIQVDTVINNHIDNLKQIGIHNAAAVVIDIKNGNTLAYVGNSRAKEVGNHSNDVNIIHSKRSPGSLLKPILYGLCMDDGIITPKGFIKDIPLYYKGFKPENYSYNFSGIVNSDKAIQKSLNIPFVNLLNSYDYTRFYDKLSQLGLSFPYNADHYGLTMILGGAETSLWELTSLYAGAARSLNYFNANGTLSSDNYYKNRYIPQKTDITDDGFTYISPGSLYTMFQTMTKLTRPNSLGKWEVFNSSYPIAWKTGTSTGFKDAWAIGFTKDYLVGVWSGNADGEGRANLVGVKTSAPILFDIFKLLPATDFFGIPVTNMILRQICSDSGFLAGPNCSSVENSLLPKNKNYPVCSFHKILHLDETMQYQVKFPYPQYKMNNIPWLVFDPVTSWYYKRSNPNYIPPPPQLNGDKKIMEFIYPDKSSLIYVPVQLDGDKGSTIFEIAHREETTLYWHMDGKYMGYTEHYHQKLLTPAIGRHEITVVDSEGNEINRFFEIIK